MAFMIWYLISQNLSYSLILYKSLGVLSWVQDFAGVLLSTKKKEEKKCYELMKKWYK